MLWNTYVMNNYNNNDNNNDTNNDNHNNVDNYNNDNNTANTTTASTTTTTTTSTTTTTTTSLKLRCYCFKTSISTLYLVNEFLSMFLFHNTTTKLTAYIQTAITQHRHIIN